MAGINVFKGLAKSFAKYADEVVETPTSVKTATEAPDPTRFVSDRPRVLEGVEAQPSTRAQQSLALRSYQKTARTTNKILRDVKGDREKLKDVSHVVEGETASMSNYIKVLDEATSETFEENRVLFRGVALPEEKIQKYEKGKTFTNPEFLSYSKSGVKAREFAMSNAGQNSRPVVFEIHGASGIKAKDMRNFRDFDEAEVLLGRNQQFEAVEVKKMGGMGSPEVTKVILRPKNKEQTPLIMSYRDGVDSPDSNMIALPMKDGSINEKPIIEKDPERVLNRIVNATDEEIAEKYPDVDVQQLKTRAQAQLGE